MGYLIIGALLLLIVLAMLYLLVRWLWLKGRYGRLLIASSLLALLWSIYDAVYPSESFYAAELQHLIKISLPAESKFIYKTATYPDIHGDYSACFIVHLPATAFDKLKASIASEPMHQTISLGCTHMDKSQRPLNTTANKYILTKRATREDVEISIELIPNHNQAVISWYLW